MAWDRPNGPRPAEGTRERPGWDVVRRPAVAIRDASGARFRGLLEAAPDAMVVVDKDGEIVLLNVQAEKQFGYRRDELVGQPVTNIIPVGFAERLIADDLRSAAEALAQQIGTGIELSGRRKDGSEFPIEIMLSPLESAEGILVTAAIRNISVRKEAEGQLLQAQKLESIGRLAGGIAHDFNNMLFVINGHAEMLDQDLAPEHRATLDLDETLRNVRAIREAGERAATLTAQLLAFSRQQVISPTVLDLNAAIDGIEPMVRKLIGENMRLVVKLGRRRRSHPRGRGPARPDPRQSRRQRPRRDAGRRNGDDRDRDGRWSTRKYATEHFDAKPGAVRPARRQRHRDRDGSHDAGAHLRALLHDEADRQGDRPRARHRLRNRPPGGRPRLGLLRARPGVDVQALLPARRRPGIDGGARRVPVPPPSEPARSSSSRTSRWFAT